MLSVCKALRLFYWAIVCDAAYRIVRSTHLASQTDRQTDKSNRPIDQNQIPDRQTSRTGQLIRIKFSKVLLAKYSYIYKAFDFSRC